MGFEEEARQAAATARAAEAARRAAEFNDGAREDLAAFVDVMDRCRVPAVPIYAGPEHTFSLWKGARLEYRYLGEGWFIPSGEVLDFAITRGGVLGNSARLTARGVRTPPGRFPRVGLPGRGPYITCDREESVFTSANWHGALPLIKLAAGRALEAPQPATRRRAPLMPHFGSGMTGNSQSDR